MLAVTRKAITSACKVIMRADDSSGIIGDAIRQLLELHAQLVRTAPPPYRKLVDWMVRFQFDNECDFFEIDPVAYAPALGERSLAVGHQAAKASGCWCELLAEHPHWNAVPAFSLSSTRPGRRSRR
ncbi:MAG: hypothetical protein VB080_10220 [Propionicimonas sp.]|nr:hypothetical protein [Propionicimonas sp.]